MRISFLPSGGVGQCLAIGTYPEMSCVGCVYKGASVGGWSIPTLLLRSNSKISLMANPADCLGFPIGPVIFILSNNLEENHKIYYLTTLTGTLIYQYSLSVPFSNSRHLLNCILLKRDFDWILRIYFQLSPVPKRQ